MMAIAAERGMENELTRNLNLMLQDAFSRVMELKLALDKKLEITITIYLSFSDLFFIKNS